MTTDRPFLGVRYNEWRNDFRTPAGPGVSKGHDADSGTDAHRWLHSVELGFAR